MSKIKNENYIVIQGWMINELGLKGNELIVYAVIYGFSQTDNQRFTGSLQYLADWTKATKQGVLKNLKSLIEKGYIVKEEKHIKGVKFCEYYATEFNGVLNSVEQGIKQSLTGGIKHSLPNNTNIDIKEDSKIDKIDNTINVADYNIEFEEIWSLYPRKQGKANAFKAYIKARHKGVSRQTIIDGINAYLHYIKLEKIDVQYIKHGSTWFNQECWNDDYNSNRPLTTKDIAEKMDFSDFRDVRPRDAEPLF